MFKKNLFCLKIVNFLLIFIAMTVTYANDKYDFKETSQAVNTVIPQEVLENSIDSHSNKSLSEKQEITVVFVGASISSGIYSDSIKEWQAMRQQGNLGKILSSKYMFTLLKSYLSSYSLKDVFELRQKHLGNTNIRLIDASPASMSPNFIKYLIQRLPFIEKWYPLVSFINPWLPYYSYQVMHHPVYSLKNQLAEKASVVIALDGFFWPIYNKDWSGTYESTDNETPYEIHQLELLLNFLDKDTKTSYVVGLIPFTQLILGITQKWGWGYVPTKGLVDKANKKIKDWVDNRNKKWEGKVLAIDFSFFYPKKKAPSLANFNIPFELNELKCVDGIHPSYKGLEVLTAFVLQEMEKSEHAVFQEIAETMEINF